VIAWLPALLGLAVCLSPLTAGAQTRAEQAAELRKAAGERMDARDYEGAREQYEASIKLEKKAVALWNLGRCAEQLGDFAAAQGAFASVVADKGTPPDVRAAATVRSEAMNQAARGVEQLAGGAMQDAVESFRTAIRFLKAGEWAERYPPPAALYMKLGDAQVAAKDLKGARKSYEKVLDNTVAPDALKDKVRDKIAKVDADLAAAEADANKPKDPGPKPDPNPKDPNLKPDKDPNAKPKPDSPGVRTGSGPRIGAGSIITGAVGFVAVGFGVYFATQSRATWNEVANAKQEAGLVTGLSQSAAQERSDLASSQATRAWISYGVGAAGIITGVVLALVRGSDKDNVTVTPSPRGTTLGLRF